MNQPPSTPGAIGEPANSARRHGMEPKGEFLLQLLQGGGVGGNGRSGRPAPSPSSLEDFSHEVEGSSSTWQHRDPAVAALGPSHSYHAGELLQPNQLFTMAPQYGGGGGVWTPPQQFFSPSHDPRTFGGAHPRGPHQQLLANNRFPPYPLSPQLTEQWRSENTGVEFSRRDQGWLPPPHARSDGGGIAARPWTSGPIPQGGKSPLPPPLPPPAPASQQQQFLGNGAELLQLLLGGGSQNLTPSKPTSGAGFPEELFGEGLTGGIQVDNTTLPRAQVHGPIGPPKRNEATTEPSPPAGGEDLLGRFWATASSLSNGSPEPSKPSVSSSPEEQMRSLSLGGGHKKEGIPSPFESSKQRSFGFSPEQSKSKVSKPPGFFGERDHNTSGLPIDPNFVSSTVKALNQFSEFQGVAKGPLAWEKFQDGTTDMKQENASRPSSDDRGEASVDLSFSSFFHFCSQPQSDITWSLVEPPGEYRTALSQGDMCFL